MKKNYMMRIAAVLLVLVLLSTCVISGTFAKYVTADSADDSARVAKWGISVEVGSEAFEIKYAKDDNDTAFTNTVVASEDVVAPGTKGTLATVAIEGTPEVAYEVKVETDLELEKWAVNGAYYCPLVIKVGDIEIKGLEYNDQDSFETAVENAIKESLTGNTTGVVEYESGTSSDKELTVTWSWAFEGVNDANDTILGDAAANDNAATIDFELTVTVTQID